MAVVWGLVANRVVGVGSLKKTRYGDKKGAECKVSIFYFTDYLSYFQPLEMDSQYKKDPRI